MTLPTRLALSRRCLAAATVFFFPLKRRPAVEPKAIRSLIVLPFRMLRPDPGTDFLAFSLPEALTTSLSGLKSLVVRSSLAASRFSVGTQDLKTIAAEAHVDLIVTGPCFLRATKYASPLNLRMRQPGR